MKNSPKAYVVAIAMIPEMLFLASADRREGVAYVLVDTFSDFNHDRVHPLLVLRKNFIRALTLPVDRHTLRDACSLLYAAIVNPNSCNATLKGGAKCGFVTHQTIEPKN